MADFIAGALGLIALGGCGYLAFAIVRVAQFAKESSVVSAGEPVSVLKPVSGLEAELYENLASFCDQEYAVFQVVFGVRHADDPAIPIIRQVIERFPERDIQLVIDARVDVRNPKVANLLNMAAVVKYDLIVIADADMRVDRQYLRAVTAPFSRPSVGAVTCPYVGVPSGGLASQLGAMYINEQFLPSVLVASAIEPLRYCFGSTMAVRNDVLESIGGLRALGDHLGDDYMLGYAVSERGSTVALSPYIVRNVVFEPSLSALWRHELRWARTVLAQRPRSYLGLIVTYPLPLALLFLAISHNVLFGVLVLGLAMFLRVSLQQTVRDRLDRSARAPWWLIPVRDVFGFAVWCAAFFARTVRWRRDDVRVHRGGAL